MKRSNKIIILEISVIILSFFCFFLFNISRYMYLAYLIILCAGISIVLKGEKRKERFRTDVLLIVIISVLFYYFFTYLSGFFFGFYYSSYSKSLYGMAVNIVHALAVILCVEMIRELFIKNHNYHKSIVFITPIICILLELPFLINFRMISSNVDMFNAVLSILVPCVVKNCILTYITYKANMTSSTVYQLLMLLPKYFLPVFPNLGDFLEIVVQVLLPGLILLLIINVTTVKFRKVKDSRKLKRNNILLITVYSVAVMFIGIMVCLTSDMFRFSSLAIGSGSMTGSINKGDVVIIDKRNIDVKEGDVIAFRQMGRIIVHRIYKVKDAEKRIYITKGDANQSVDPIDIKPDSYVGKVVMKINYVGWPTVYLSELIKNK